MSTRELTTGQTAVLATAAVAMTVVGGVGAWGTYTNAVSEFHRQATAAGVVAAGEGLTLILALIMLGRTMLGQSSPAVVRAGMWIAPVSASGIGLAIATSAREAAVYAVTPLAMSGAAEGLGFIARSVVVYTTGRDAEADRRNAHTVQQLAFQQALSTGHPDDDKKEAAVRKAWKLIGKVGVGDQQLGGDLVDVSREKLTLGASHALGQMLALPQADARPAAPAPRSASATDVLRARFATMDPAAAIRLAHEARPDAPPAEIATMLGTYGVPVDPVAVALVLGTRPAEYEVHRGDTGDAPQVNALPAVNLQGAVEEAASILGPDAKAKEIAEHLARRRRLLVDEPYIRAALSRAAKKAPPAPQPQPDALAKRDEGNGGYA
ncbi:hypothetical protein [Streptomyces sp. 351MFTsu5.1]|uniref:hypothetical protein n=1 Tax=Streptomyces sp. 351MFTsu5.1 TaxID=1172180 RepID=UPI0003AA360E|nr:hypothetical protein [Streptomyces sp. 351MFTsu5.1]